MLALQMGQMRNDSAEHQPQFQSSDGMGLFFGTAGQSDISSCCDQPCKAMHAMTQFCKQSDIAAWGGPYHIDIMDGVLLWLIGLVQLEPDNVDDPQGRDQREQIQNGVDIVFHHETASSTPHAQAASPSCQEADDLGMHFETDGMAAQWREAGPAEKPYSKEERGELL